MAASGAKRSLGDRCLNQKFRTLREKCSAFAYGKPINSNKCSEAADGVARESVKSCPRAGCGKSACPVVCPVKAGMFSRRQTCRGRSQSPVVWIEEVMETETLKPIDKVSP